MHQFYPPSPTIEEIEIVHYTIVNMLQKLLEDSESGHDMALVFLLVHVLGYNGVDTSRAMGTSETRVVNLKDKIKKKLVKFNAD